MTNRTLSVTRAADRTVMAKKVFDIAIAGGAHAILGSEFDSPREITVTIEAAGGLRLHADFDGGSRQQREGVFVPAWHMKPGSDNLMTYEFGRAAGAEVNPFHFSKCTSVAYGFDDLCEQITDVLALVRDGGAFQRREAA